jgi:hypothetical protein
MEQGKEQGTDDAGCGGWVEGRKRRKEGSAQGGARQGKEGARVESGHEETVESDRQAALPMCFSALRTGRQEP